MALNLEALKTQLDLLFRTRPVRLAYLFGSQTTGRATAESDIDVAVLFAQELDGPARLAERLALVEGLIRLLRTDAVDVAVLNDASPLLAMEVLRTGKIVYKAGEMDRIDFQVRTVREYEDTEPLRRLLAEAMDARLRAGTYGTPTLKK